MAKCSLRIPVLSPVQPKHHTGFCPFIDRRSSVLDALQPSSISNAGKALVMSRVGQPDGPAVAHVTMRYLEQARPYQQVARNVPHSFLLVGHVFQIPRSACYLIRLESMVRLAVTIPRRDMRNFSRV